ncbi:MAG: asparagine synthase-related protein, partial [Solirubrobacterales bacterium]
MPLRTLAGAYDPSGRWRREDRERRMRVALGDGAARVVSEGPLTVAWTGSGERSTNAALAPPTPAGRAGSPLCVLDGTIYNLEDLALRTGVPPASAEAVLAAAYQRFGERSLEWLRGDFALVLWDPATERGMFARDQMGGRSLVWSAAGGALLFASEVRSLLRACERRPDPDDVAMAHWLAVSGPPEDRTLYERIHRLEPGHFARLGGKAWTTHEYWSPRPTATLSGSFTEHAGLLRDALTEAVGRRCAPDARTGVMLSGGLDSSSVAALAARTLEPTQRPARAYSATFPRHPSADESSLIQLVTDPLAL